MKHPKEGSCAKVYTERDYPWRFLLIDDDQIFCCIMRRQAESMGAYLRFCHSVGELSKIEDIGQYDAILVDYHLGVVKGSVVSGFLNIFFGNAPVMIVSSTSDWWHKTGAEWPTNVRRFVHKDRPVDEILDQAIEVASNTLMNEIEDDELQFNLSAEPVRGGTRLTRTPVFHRRMMNTAAKAMLKGASLFLPTKSEGL